MIRSGLGILGSSVTATPSISKLISNILLIKDVNIVQYLHYQKLINNFVSEKCNDINIRNISKSHLLEALKL